MASHIFLFSTPFLVFSLLAYASFFASFAYSASTGAAEVANGRKEAEALLEWKVTLDNRSQSLLSSWAGDSPCNWFGISCNKSGSVSNISLPNSSLRVTHLYGLQIISNRLSGNLPRDVCLGGLLSYFGAFDNYFTGPIPKSLKNCSSLVRLRLERNQLSGNISEAFGTHPHLNYMDLSDNELHGELSLKWEQFNNLTAFKISGNKISGEIPAALGKATHLQVLDLSSNQLVGRIPKELGNLKLIELALNDNRLSGDIPFDVAALSDLEKLGLAGNNFSATIPKQLGKCSKMIFLNMSKNRFTKLYFHQNKSLP
ncbi:MDIS1-interacting receptor like kinase 2-like [Populus alba x Populus x berolinensis]|nr:MDIS1-interacting receptor like kinase 2-like [Populus alba x Populus x berolinensis]